MPNLMPITRAITPMAIGRATKTVPVTSLATPVKAVSRISVADVAVPDKFIKLGTFLSPFFLFGYFKAVYISVQALLYQ